MNIPQTNDAELAIAMAKIKNLNNRIHELEQVKSQVDSLKTMIKGLQVIQAELGRRIAVNEERQTVRQEMLFDGIKRIAEDVQHVKDRMQSLEAVGKDGTESAPGSAKKALGLSETPNVKSPGPAKAANRTSENRKNFERALEHHVDEMNAAETITDVKKSGKLAVKYSNELLKNYL
ncbi:hypothetical protein CONLIGDRAFT_650436 [Coniochaeta ligniaria NRRL 30616]|uniref:Uncharacterized protein n=1 Tax=Coniochaeta ligniaria NRRL 30616 TaxID=1408157 RepID=A0A1J7J527_9PEZI|nr:hypothetical protein CONLIGDRAFT_650436 [Coniochaeta ligniaria NRRL 30616]